MDGTLMDVVPGPEPRRLHASKPRPRVGGREALQRLADSPPVLRELFGTCLSFRI